MKLCISSRPGVSLPIVGCGGGDDDDDDDDDNGDDLLEQKPEPKQICRVSGSISAMGSERVTT